MIKDYGEMQVLGQSNVDSAVRMFSGWNNNWQTIAAEMSEYFRRLFDDGNMTLEKLTASRSVEQAVQIHIDYAGRAFEDYMKLMTNIGFVYMNTALEFYDLIGGGALKFSASR